MPWDAAILWVHDNIVLVFIVGSIVIFGASEKR